MSDDVLQCCDCGHVFEEGNARLMPYADDVNADWHICPHCDCKDHYLLIDNSEVTDD